MPFVQETAIDFLGKGVTFPIVLINGKPPIQSGIDLIESSMKIIISWPIGRRFFLTEFASRVTTVLEEPNTEIQQRLLEAHIKDCIEQWEPRVEYLGIQVTDVNPTKKEVVVTYRIINSQQIRSFIYPLYKNINY